MKKLFKALSIAVFCAFLAISNPVIAQSSDPNTTTASTSNNDDDTGKWGLAGLLGLLGLLGLRKKDDDYRNRSTTNVNR
jgi:MYXO-CTERM domain-containing protein